MKRNLYKFKIVLADDHSLILLGLKMLIGKLSEHVIVGEASNPRELSLLLSHARCDILLTDFFMPDESYRDGLKMLEHIRKDSPALTILVVTMLENPLLISALLNIGVNGVVSKATVEQSLENALLKITMGQRFLDPYVYKILSNARLADERGIILLNTGEVEVLSRFRMNMSISAIAAELGLDRRSVVNSIRSAMKKLDLNTSSELEQYLLQIK